MQGTDGPLGGPDVRRRIPIKLLPKQARNKPTPRPQRPTGRLPSKAHSAEEGIVSVFISNEFIYCIFRYRGALQKALVFWSGFLLEGFNFKKEDRFDCGVKAGDAFVSQRRFPQQLYWDYKVKAALYNLPTSQMLVFKVLWTLSLSLFLVKFDRWKGWDACSFLWQMWTAS